MNAKQRKRLEEIQSVLQELAEEIDMMAEEEQEKFDNLPEGLQQSERGERFEQAADNLNDIRDNIETTIESIYSIFE